LSIKAKSLFDPPFLLSVKAGYEIMRGYQIRTRRFAAHASRMRRGRTSGLLPRSVSVSFLLSLSRAIDWINERVGRSVLWLVLIAVLISAGNAIVR
jgi:hypothetical protein